jgi:hypothetical protein
VYPYGLWPGKGNKQTWPGSDWWVTTYGPVSWVGLEVLITFGSVVGLGPGCSSGAASWGPRKMGPGVGIGLQDQCRGRVVTLTSHFSVWAQGFDWVNQSLGSLSGPDPATAVGGSIGLCIMAAHFYMGPSTHSRVAGCLRSTMRTHVSNSEYREVWGC